MIKTKRQFKNYKIGDIFTFKGNAYCKLSNASACSINPNDTTMMYFNPNTWLCEY